MSDVECQHGLASKKAWTTSSHWPSNFFDDGDCVKILVMMIPYIYYIEFFRQETWRQAFQRCWLARHPGFVNNTIAQCVVCKVRCHCILYGPGIRYSDIFGAPGIRYSVIIKSWPCICYRAIMPLNWKQHHTLIYILSTLKPLMYSATGPRRS